MVSAAGAAVVPAAFGCTGLRFATGLTTGGFTSTLEVTNSFDSNPAITRIATVIAPRIRSRTGARRTAVRRNLAACAIPNAGCGVETVVPTFVAVFPLRVPDLVWVADASAVAVEL